MYSFRRIGMPEAEQVRQLFLNVFTREPWYDDWSDEGQLDRYLEDLMGHSNSLAYGLYEDDEIVGLSMGHIRHWYTGTEYYIDEFCIRSDRQGMGLGTMFMEEIETAIKDLGLVQIYLCTEKDVPAYEFYLRNGFTELTGSTAFAKDV